MRKILQITKFLEIREVLLAKKEKKKKKSYSQIINLTEENDSFLTNCEENAKELNNFF